jgi:hypothetical protein
VVPPVFALNQPLLPSIDPSKKMFQTALRNPFFRMRRDNSTRKNSCQAKNALLQSSQDALPDSIGEALQVFIMLPFASAGKAEIRWQATPSDYCAGYERDQPKQGESPVVAT